MKSKRFSCCVLGCALALAVASAHGGTPSTAFTFQGHLKLGGVPLNASADFEFSLHDADVKGSQVGSTVTVSDVNVVDGQYAVQLDFGSAVFDGADLWLEIAVRSPHDPSDTELFSTLGPRQQVTPTPYALQTRGIFVDDDGNVSVGVVGGAAAARLGGGPPANFHAKNSSPSGLAIFGETDSPTGATVGVKGSSVSVDGRGVEGSAPTEGVFGEATAASGSARGVCGVSASTDGQGMFGQATALTGPAEGVRGQSDSVNGTGVAGEAPTEGVRGDATATSGTARGVCGVSASTEGQGMFGQATAVSGPAEGVRGQSNSPDGTGVVGQAPNEGVRGEATALSGTARGLCGISASTDGQGVFGEATAASGAAEGVRGESSSTSGTGVFGQAPACGVAGISTAVAGASEGVRGESLSNLGTGVFGLASSTNGETRGVYGRTDSNEGMGVHGEAVNTEGQTYGVRGTSNSNDAEAAGVRAEGAGAAGPNNVGAAALDISGGVIRVSGSQRTAGTIEVSGTWTAIESCKDSGHSHVVGHYIDAEIDNFFIVSDSIIMVTVETDEFTVNRSFHVHVHSKEPGSAMVRLTVVGNEEPGCNAPGMSQIFDVHYLIINPAGT